MPGSFCAGFLFFCTLTIKKVEKLRRLCYCKVMDDFLPQNAFFFKSANQAAKNILYGVKQFLCLELFKGISL